MTAGADGYTTDVNYPAFFHKEMQPLWLDAVARLLGVAAAPVRPPFRQLELGCGLGINLLVAAACHPQAEFVGVDFNARHLQIARAAASAAGLRNLEFVHAGFAEFAASRPQPFDRVLSHGVWSWIAPAQQAALLDVVDAVLPAGGLFYLHYMCQPGAGELAPLQQLLHQFAPHVPGDSGRKVQAGLQLLRHLADRGMFAERPAVLRHLHNLLAKDHAHLAHEFLTDHWRPQHATEVHAQVGARGLAYLGSADVFNNLDPSLSIPGQLQDVVVQTRIPALAETLRDMARNSHQRMDLFQRAPRLLEEAAHRAALEQLRLQALPGAPTQGPFSFRTPIGPIEAPAAACQALLQRLAAAPASVAELAALPAMQAHPQLLLPTLQLMLMQAWVHPVQDDAAAAAPQVERLAQWFGRHQVALRIVAPCGTALGPP